MSKRLSLRRVFDIGSISQYYRLAPYVRPSVKGDDRILYNLRNTREALKLENLGAEIIDEISKWIEELDAKYNEGDHISEEDAERLSQSVEKWRQILRNELDAKTIFTIELKSGLNFREIQKLANKEASEFIPQNIWDRLTDIEKSDFSDAAKCLMLDTATPSAMVALRGAEASIRNFYSCKTQSDVGERTWRQLTRELKGKSEALGIEDTFIGFLDYIGAAKRNFAQHPNKVYTLREAVFIFMQVMAMVEDIYSKI